MILFPDQRVTNQPDNESVCFGAPIDMCDWEYLRGIGTVLSHTGMTFVIIAQDDRNDVYFMRNDSEITNQVCLILRNNEDPDICIESAAWVRIQENFPGMIYIVKGKVDYDKWQTYAATLGANPEYVCMVELNIPQFED